MHLPAQWWRDAVIYQVYVRSFADSDGDGIGDLDGVASRLGYVELLGADAVLLTPVYPSPMADHSYAVADPRDVDPVFGDLAGFDVLVERAHEHGLRLLVDLAPNHTSVEHEWFRAALASAPGSPERARYHFRPGRGPDGATPPNGWTSTVGGPAWTRVTDADGRPREWYLHLFAPEQPDLNWTNPEVWADLEKTLRFWLDRGVDGFRIEAAHGMSKPASLTDAATARRNPFDNDEVHEIHRMIRSVVEDYPGRATIGGIDLPADERFAAYLRAGELNLGYSRELAGTPFDADAIRETVERTLAAAASAGAPPTWALAHHDVSRAVTRYGGGPSGTARALAMAMLIFALPGTVLVYYGEELGLTDVDLPMPWEGGEPGYGFTTGAPWLPMPPEYGELVAADQLEDTASMLSAYRSAIELRRSHPGLGGDAVEWFGAPPGCLAFRRTDSTLVCALNASAAPVPLPPGEVLLASGPLEFGELAPDTAVWLA
ncbi:MAG: DUF3459 domain-containing protein [Pseudonocardia sp.]|nr:DUF3459 domain-containing protein [Pseudonocardia sp.]